MNKQGVISGVAGGCAFILGGTWYSWYTVNDCRWLPSLVVGVVVGVVIGAFSSWRSRKQQK